MKNAHAGKQCVVVLGGPSVEKVDVNLFADHPYVLGVNGSFLKRNNFKYYFCSSINFYKPNEERIRKVDADRFFFSDDVPFSRERNRVYVSLDKESPIWKLPETDLNFNILRPVPWGPTVLLDIVMPACLWMGFSEIILVGADYSTKSYKRFYDGSPSAPQRVRSIDNESEMELAHKSMNRLVSFIKLKKIDVKIYNCSPLSELTQFKKLLLEDVLNNKGEPLLS